MERSLFSADFGRRCPACAHTVAMPFFDAGTQPLATLAFPETRDEAVSLPRFRLRFVRCVDCGHVYNPEFDYDQVPYAKHPNKMFNLGTIWRDHLRQVEQLILDAVPPRPCVVEIGCGDGHLLRALAEARPAGRYVGFDPNSKVDTGDGAIEARAELFLARRHLEELKPQMIVARHVLEHLVDPLALLEEIAFAASCLRRPTRLFVEVPCVDLAIESCRTADFFYEHNSHFTSHSLRRMLERCGASIELLEKGYGGEVAYAVAEMPVPAHQREIGRQALAFAEHSKEASYTLAAQLDAISRSGRRVAIWGGTGKAAALINQCNMDVERFPLVVDSDRQKAGTFVPGTGQRIQFRDVLIEQPADLIIIATQWRAADIVLEMQQMGIGAELVLIEHRGRLIDYFHDEHPYRYIARPAGRAWHRAESHAPLPPPIGGQPWSLGMPTEAAGG
ncbi:MAG: class I SAM-dependent methyltransferase [Thermoguttaceae bacterium]|nr:class I SAM-dependent methyltransferase [Thermoguttaceae bacterium]